MLNKSVVIARIVETDRCYLALYACFSFAFKKGSKVEREYLVYDPKALQTLSGLLSQVLASMALGQALDW